MSISRRSSTQILCGMITHIMIFDIVSTVVKLEGRAMIFHFALSTLNVRLMSLRTSSCSFANSFFFFVVGCYTDEMNMDAFG